MDTDMTSYDFDHTILILCQAIDFAEVEKDFTPLRRWVSEGEQSGYGVGAMDNRLKLPAGQEDLMRTLRSVAVGTVSPEEAILRIRRWLNSDQMQAVETELKKQYQCA